MALIVTMGIAIGLQILLVLAPTAVVLLVFLARRLLHSTQFHPAWHSSSRWRKDS